jgi:hypothetical protein
MYNTSVTLHHSEECTPEVLSNQIQLFKLLTGEPASLELDGLTVVVHNFSASSTPVFNASTNQPSECCSAGWLLVQSLICKHHILVDASCRLNLNLSKLRHARFAGWNAQLLPPPPSLPTQSA